jgi:hypothetical protein
MQRNTSSVVTAERILFTCAVAFVAVVTAVVIPVTSIKARDTSIAFRTNTVAFVAVVVAVIISVTQGRQRDTVTVVTVEGIVPARYTVLFIAEIPTIVVSITSET